MIPRLDASKNRPEGPLARADAIAAGTQGDDAPAVDAADKGEGDGSFDGGTGKVGAQASAPGARPADGLGEDGLSEDATPGSVTAADGATAERIVARAFAVATAVVAQHADDGASAVPAVTSPGRAAVSDIADCAQDRAPTGRAWDPVPVPPPTYAMKPAAPQATIPDSAGAETRAEAESVSTDQSATSGADEPSNRVPPPPEEPAAESTSRPRMGPPEPDPGDEAKPKTETLGLDLNEILARRRVAGQ